MSGATCRRCGTPITFVTTAAGRSMPLDGAPPVTTDDGNVQLVDGLAHVLGPLDIELLRARNPDVQVYRPHFVSCPNWKGNR